MESQHDESKDIQMKENDKKNQMNEIEDTIRLSMQESSKGQSSKEDIINKGDGRNQLG